ncbi:MAG: aldo/keto reductase [Acidobacteria bacterium]|nr:aldo/keto reductase [Acidobacteriota bacterium]
MERRTFIQVTSGALGLTAEALAAMPMPMAKLGKSGLQVSKFCLGGFHMAKGGEENAVRIIQRAIDLGVTFFDSAHKYHKGLSDEFYGKALAPYSRQKVLLMSKAELRTKDDAMRQLEDTLRRMKTDYLDLWQCHEVVRQDEVDKIFGPGGSLEAFVLAKKQGKVRHIGFTGHADPATHMALLNGYDGWETVQHPVNLIDPHYLSFIHNFLPKAAAKGLGRIGMKSNAIGNITKHSVATIPECLRFAWTQDIHTLVSGVETVEQLEQNVAACKTFQKMSPQEISTLLDRTRQGLTGTEVETYKRAPAGAAVHARRHKDGEGV